MKNFVIANNINTTLANPITSSGQTTIVLSSSAGLPTLSANQQMALTLNDAATQSVFEVVYVTAITGASLTVVRGQEGTSANTWLVGDFAYAASTAGFQNVLVQLSPVSAQTGSINILGAINLGSGANSALNGTLDIVTQAATSTAITVTGHSSQTADFFKIMDSTGAITMFAFTPSNGVTSVPSLDIGPSGTTYSLRIATTNNYCVFQQDTGSINTIFADVIGIINNTTLEIAIDGGGNMGVNGTVHQTSRRSRKHRIEYIDPSEALEVIMATKIARYDWIEEPEMQADGHLRHASFIADEAPWQLGGGPGYEHADPQKTASYTLAALQAVYTELQELKRKQSTT